MEPAQVSEVDDSCADQRDSFVEVVESKKGWAEGGRMTKEGVGMLLPVELDLVELVLIRH